MKAILNHEILEIPVNTIQTNPIKMINVNESIEVPDGDLYEVKSYILS